MPQISTVVRILDLHNRVGALGNPPPNPQADALVLAYLNGPPHNFGVQQVQLQTGGVLAGTVKVLITVAQIPPNQKIIFDALK